VFDRDLRHGKLKHIEYNSANKTLSWHKPKTNNQEAVQTGFYGKLQAHDIADIFRFVNQQCGFLSAFTTPNWMADEIMWRARLNPKRQIVQTPRLPSQVRKLRRTPACS
jgi:hypothetical protein